MGAMDALRRRMQDYKEQLSEYMISGGPKDYLGYAKTVARIETVQLLLDDIVEIEARYIED